MIVRRIAAADHQTVGGREPGQGEASQRRPHAACRSVHQTLESLGVGEQGHVGFLFRRLPSLDAAARPTLGGFSDARQRGAGGSAKLPI